MLDDSLYVDDLFSGFDTVDKAFKLSCEAVSILKQASMNFWKFETNSKQLRKKWLENGFSINPTENASSSLKVLVIIWDIGEDILKPELESMLNESDSKGTKRNILRTVALIHLGSFLHF